MLRQDKDKKDSLDFFETPTAVIKFIIPYLDKSKKYYDPCVGRGQIVKILNNNDLKSFGSDIREKNIYGVECIDFINDDVSRFIEDNTVIIMNPPFNLSVEFIIKALTLVDEVIIFEKLSFMASKRRKDLINNHLQDIYICSKRPSMYKADPELCVEAEYIEKGLSGTIDFAWYRFVNDKKIQTIQSIG